MSIKCENAYFSNFLHIIFDFLMKDQEMTNEPVIPRKMTVHIINLPGYSLLFY